MAKRTNRPFPPEGAKEPFKIFNGVSWRPSKQRGGDLKEESSSSFPTRREKHGAIREKGNLKAPYHLDSFFSCERATLRQEQCDADQTVEPCNSRSNVEIERSKPRCFSYSSSYARSQKMRRSWIEKHWIYFFFETQIFFFLFLLFKSLLICWRRNDDNRIDGSKKNMLDLKENWKEEDILDSTWRKLELLSWW